jgi:capsular polysaccharide transport system ATP-binding protein
MITLRNVFKTYRVGNSKNCVLDGVSATFPTGRNVGILGLNGAGKSTLLRIIGSVEPADRGAIEKDVKVSWPIAFNGAIHINLTGRENARFIARIYGEPTRVVEEFAESFTELGPYFDAPAYTYSTGMRARLAFAISIAAHFDCYLVDEVTSVGDMRFTLKYRRAFREKLKDASLIMVSHNPQTIRDYCDMGGVLHHGQLTIFSTIDEAMANYEEIALRSSP